MKPLESVAPLPPQASVLEVQKCCNLASQLRPCLSSLNCLTLPLSCMALRHWISGSADHKDKLIRMYTMILMVSIGFWKNAMCWGIVFSKKLGDKVTKAGSTIKFTLEEFAKQPDAPLRSPSLWRLMLSFEPRPPRSPRKHLSTHHWDRASQAEPGIEAV